jgi:periplasmic divalent cation tolerance protein
MTVVPRVRSVNRWEGHLEQVSEILMLIKTCDARDSAVEAYLRAHHPYDTPKIVEIPAGRVTARYRQWVVQEMTHC